MIISIVSHQLGSLHYNKLYTTCFNQESSSGIKSKLASPMLVPHHSAKDRQSESCMTHLRPSRLGPPQRPTTTFCQYNIAYVHKYIM